MQISYISPNGKIELSAFINGETGLPTYILHFLGNSAPMNEDQIRVLRRYIPQEIAPDTTIVECKNAMGTNKNLKKNLEIKMTDAIDHFKLSNKNSWGYYMAFVEPLFKFIRFIYNQMSLEQKATDQMNKLDMILKELNM